MKGKLSKPPCEYVNVAKQVDIKQPNNRMLVLLANLTFHLRHKGFEILGHVAILIFYLMTYSKN